MHYLPEFCTGMAMKEGYHNRGYDLKCFDLQIRSESVCAEIIKLTNQLNEATQLNRREVEHQLEKRIDNVEFNKKEAQDQRKNVSIEVDDLNVYKDRISGAIKSLEEPQKFCNMCLTMCKNNVPVDSGHNEIIRELMKEMEILKGTEEAYKKTLDQVIEQIRCLKSAMYFLDADIFDKEEGLQIDRRILSPEAIVYDLLKPFRRGQEFVDPSKLTLEQWDIFTTKRIQTAAHQITNSMELKSYVDVMLKTTMDDLVRTYNKVNKIFRGRIETISEEKSKLEIQHSEVVRRVSETQNSIVELQKCMEEKENSMALARSRFFERCHRSGNELCQDGVQRSLKKEIADLEESVNLLERGIAEAENNLRRLFRTQIRLEDEINIKTNLIKIDEVDCLTLRQSIKYHPF